MSIAQATKERPIEFSGPSATDDIRAIISGAKTQHRLLVNPQPTQDKRGNWVRVNRRGCPVSLHRESTTTCGNSVVNRESVCIAPPECIYRLWPASVVRIAKESSWGNFIAAIERYNEEHGDAANQDD